MKSHHLVGASRLGSINCGCSMALISLVVIVAVGISGSRLGGGVFGHPGSHAGHNNHNSSRESKEQLANLFDYDHYKKIFGKSYSSQAEDSMRRLYFYSRALAAFESGINYKYRNINYYKALNHMSDWSPEERAMTANKRHGVSRRMKTTKNRSELEEKNKLKVKKNKLRASQLGRRQKQPLVLAPVEGEEPEETLRNYLEAHADDEPKYRDLLRQLDLKSGNKPKVVGTIDEGTHTHTFTVTKRGVRRDFSLDKLIKPRPAPAKRRSNKRDKTKNVVNSSGELGHRDLGDQLEKVEMLEVKAVDAVEAHEDESALGDQSNQTKGGDEDEEDLGYNEPELGDEIFVDHTASGCLSEVRHQGTCGSCYAFAAISIAEWLYCTKKGRLVEFSEQYMLDCGSGRIEDMDGCNGATVLSAAEFIHNFGMELHEEYPYVGRVDKCPYDKKNSNLTNLTDAGYIRLEFGRLAEIPVSLWPEAIKRGPLYLVIQADASFLDYGGGVYDGANCMPDEVVEKDPEIEYHAVVLVGHGREDNQEYWLIRNSHGPDWGEQGYYKLAKDAPETCIWEQVAYAYGTENGLDYNIRPHRNRHEEKPLSKVAHRRRRNTAK
uniref:Cathepsin L-like proteinase n=1 Tax=Aceria tosichella TaxID=561515 RepID=A0A6G1S7G1_9ACAR